MADSSCVECFTSLLCHIPECSASGLPPSFFALCLSVWVSQNYFFCLICLCCSVVIMMGLFSWISLSPGSSLVNFTTRFPPRFCSTFTLVACFCASGVSPPPTSCWPLQEDQRVCEIRGRSLVTSIPSKGKTLRVSCSDHFQSGDEDCPCPRVQASNEETKEHLYETLMAECRDTIQAVREELKSEAVRSQAAASSEMVSACFTRSFLLLRNSATGALILKAERCPTCSTCTGERRRRASR